MNRKEQEKTIASYTGRVLREQFGKGPEAVYVTVAPPYVTIYLKNFLSPIEKTIMEEKQEHSIYQLRDPLMTRVLPDVQSYIHKVTGIYLKDIYYDWELSNRSGIMAGTSFKAEALKEWDPESEEENVLEMIAEHTEVAPKRTAYRKVNHRTFLVYREECLLQVEKELIRLGYEEILKKAKRQVEKKRFYTSKPFLSLFDGVVEDVFIDWNFEKNTSVIIVVTNNRMPSFA